MDLLHERYIGISLPHAAHKHQSALAAWGCRPQEDAEGTLTLVVSGRQVESTVYDMVKFFAQNPPEFTQLREHLPGSCGVHSKHYDSDMPTTQELIAWAQSYGVRINFHHVVGGMGYNHNLWLTPNITRHEAEALQQAIHESVVTAQAHSARTPSWKEEHYGSLARQGIVRGCASAMHYIEHMQKRAHEEMIQRLITEKLQALGYFKHHNWNGHEYILAHSIP